MSPISELLDQMHTLCTSASKTTEESYRLSVEGSCLSAAQATTLLKILRLCDDLQPDPPVLRIAGESTDANAIEADTSNYGLPWKLIIGKQSLALRLSARQNESTVLFFSTERFLEWADRLDPFTQQSEFDPNLSHPTTIRVHGLMNGFGGPSLWVLPVDAEAPHQAPMALPEAEAVHALVHVTTDRQIQICPRGWALSWGDLTSRIAAPWLRMGCMALSACLVQELKRTNNQVNVILRGTKRVSLVLLDRNTKLPLNTTMAGLCAAVEWVYDQRPETRLKLVMDRLSIDVSADECFITGINTHLSAALQQAKDSYEFVILERKDAYHKEMRELMKDMKSQADLYAAKIRELISSLTRDILGILVFFGFSFIGKFDQKNIHLLLHSNELSLLLKFLAIYLLISCTLQLTAHIRDDILAYAETNKWLNILQHYTSRADNQERFIEPLNKRRTTLHVAIAVSAVLYLSLITIVLNMPFIIQLLLTQ